MPVRLLSLQGSRVGFDRSRLLASSMLRTGTTIGKRTTSTSMAIVASDSQRERILGVRSASNMGLFALAVGGLGSLCGSIASCEEENRGKHKQEEIPDVEDMPVYTMEQVAKNNGKGGTRVLMTYGGIVYDVTDFVANHPGGSEKIMMAAGSSIERFWYLYRQHFASDLPMSLMERMAVGTLAEEDQDKIDEEMEKLEENDPYAKEPKRDAKLIVHGETPMNAEVPSRIITENYLTPNSLFYIRNHTPVPYLNEKQVKEFRLKVDMTAYGKGISYFSLEEIKKLKKVEITATLQCSGNRRSGFNTFQKTSGTSWGQGAISTAKWGGVRLKDLMKLAGLEDPVEAQEKEGMEHVQFHGMDGVEASIGIEKASNPYGDVIVAYEMNGKPLPRDHGFPLRALVPGYTGVRNIKWLEKIVLSDEEAKGAHQRGLSYKILPPSISDAKNINLDAMPSVMEVSLFSGITNIERPFTGGLNPGDRTVVKASGWAWAGGGRNIVRVDVSGDEGKTWATAKLTKGTKQRFGRAWAWTFWECEVETVIGEDGHVNLASKAVDFAFNTQPDSSNHTWNVRGLGNNSWYRAEAKVI